MKRKLATILICGILSTMFVGCGAGKTADSSKGNDGKLSGKITVATNRTDIADTKLADFAKKFMEENPGTQVEFEAIKDYDNVIPTRVAGGEAPDLYYQMDSMTAQSFSDYFLPLDDIGLSSNDVYFYDNGKGNDGKLYGLTDSINYSGIIYNKKAFKQAGIDKVPTTVDELYKAGEKLKAAGIIPLGTAFKDIWPMYAWTDFKMNQIVVNGDGNGINNYVNKDQIFDETELKLMNIVRDFYKKGYLEPDIMSSNWDQFKLDISQGKVGMTYMETWFPPQIVQAGANAEDVGMFPFPEAKGLYSVAGKVWGVSKDCKSPELGKAFLKYMIKDGAYAKVGDTIPSDKHTQPSDPYVKELLSYNLPIIPVERVSDDITKIKNKAEIDQQAFLLKYVMEKDDANAKKAVDDMNDKWAKARASIIK
ncbi:ABC transporter substrate-binding protein [Clostridium chromiireducens]|uniref:ABC transporter substrate-binding protein n=1 Tax=Clostridium chromiireducens TaxID=225345 RepID=UPI003AF48593